MFLHFKFPYGPINHHTDGVPVYQKFEVWSMEYEYQKFDEMDDVEKYEVNEYI